ncbi:hypothetical protein [Streptomyces sp. NPDC048606]|uniref:hypothetical protein n=1 Tax=Streptomyces sp. NPDC048606 TaxID=3154726 RepID=UPI003446249A
MGDWIELWVRKTALWWLLVAVSGMAAWEQGWWPLRILAALIVTSALAEVARTTRGLLADPRPAKERLERHIEESPAP